MNTDTVEQILGVAEKSPRVADMLRAIDDAFIEDVTGLSGVDIFGDLIPGDCPEWACNNYNYNSARACVAGWVMASLTIEADHDDADHEDSDSPEGDKFWLDCGVEISVDGHVVQRLECTSTGCIRADNPNADTDGWVVEYDVPSTPLCANLEDYVPRVKMPQKALLQVEYPDANWYPDADDARDWTYGSRSRTWVSSAGSNFELFHSNGTEMTPISTSEGTAKDAFRWAREMHC